MFNCVNVAHCMCSNNVYFVCSHNIHSNVLHGTKALFILPVFVKYDSMCLILLYFVALNVLLSIDHLFHETALGNSI